MRQIARQRDRATLYAVNFFMADMSAEMGPFLGVLLANRGRSTGAIGTVITLGAIVGMVAVPLAGAVVDATTRKRTVKVFLSLSASPNAGTYRPAVPVRPIIAPGMDAEAGCASKGHIVGPEGSASARIRGAGSCTVISPALLTESPSPATSVVTGRVGKLDDQSL